MRRREVIALLGGAAGWPLAARAQLPAIPVVGLINAGSPETSVSRVTAFRLGLAESGYVEGQNVTIEYRWAEGRYHRYPELVADLIRRKANVIATGASGPAAFAAKTATSSIPIVFGVGEDPVRLGLVASLARPGGNVTGVNFFTAEVAAKRLGLLRELVPAATRVAVLVNPANAASAESTARDVRAAAPALGLQIQMFNAVPSARSTQPMQTSCASEPTHSWLPEMDSSIAGACNLPCWRSAMRFQRLTQCATIRKPVG